MSRLPLAQSFSVPQPMATSAASHPPTPSSSANYECEYLTTDHSATLQIFFGGLIVTALAFCVIVLPLTYCLARRSLNSRAASTPSSTKINSSRRSEWLRRALFIIAALGIQSPACMHRSTGYCSGGGGWMLGVRNNVGNTPPASIALSALH
ncbi:hypothetical protein HDU90_003499 [Geranomyces variabilis]|nr:hypothetical protein HDU90_003499 [Geranomyces variabilis]